MEEKKDLKIASSNIDASILYGKYMFQHPEVTISPDAFVAFLSVDSPERTAFLDGHCEWDVVDKVGFQLLRYKIK